MNQKAIVIFLFIGAIAGLFACSKDTFKTTPSLEIKSVSTNTLTTGETLNVELMFTDKQGDLNNGFLHYIPVRLNKRPLPFNIPGYDTIHLNLNGPTDGQGGYQPLPDASKGYLNIRFAYADLHKSDIENDTILIKFILEDAGGHTSDTTQTGNIVIVK